MTLSRKAKIERAERHMTTMENRRDFNKRQDILLNAIKLSNRLAREKDLSQYEFWETICFEFKHDYTAIHNMLKEEVKKLPIKGSTSYEEFLQSLIIKSP